MTRLSLRMRRSPGWRSCGKVAEEVVAIFAGVAVEDEHAAGAADGRRGLRDELFGEIEMEVGYAHCFDFSVQQRVIAENRIRRFRLRGRERPERLLARQERGTAQATVTRENGLGMRKRSQERSSQARCGVDVDGSDRSVDS